MAAAVELRGPKRHLLAGNLPEFRRDRLAFLTACAREYGDVVPLRFGMLRALLISHPTLIEEVLKNSRTFVKSFAYRMIRPVVGNGLLLSEGDFWLRQRRLAQPAFQRARLGAAYTPAIVDATQRLLDRWTTGEVREVHAAMMRVTAGVAGQAFFGAEVSDQVDEVSRMLFVLGELLTNRLDSVLAVLPPAMPTLTNVRVRQAVRNLDRIIFAMIERRRRDGAEHDDLLSRLLAAQDEDGSQMTNEQLRDEVMTFFLAGHETTSLLLSWTLWLLACHPAAQTRLRDEVTSTLDGHPPDVDHLAQMPYLDAVLCETLRLYPPAWVIGREPLADCEIAGHRVSKGTGVLFSQWVMQRDPRYFDSPEAFSPERWLDGLQKRLPRFAYFPFGGGQRICIGANFAMMEAGIILAMLLQRFRFGPIPNRQPEVWPAFTLRPRSGVHLLVS
ncbi:MAG TPA: cytochrome P450 [Candidatus Acidoferrum sp.]|nr:cytochrome P450 [Candidatus Acidoferrum sp.]